MIKHKILVNNRQRLIKFPSSLVRLIIQMVLEDAKLSHPQEVSVLLCKDQLIQQLNNQYMGKNNPTDVLSFPLSENLQEEGDISEMPRLLGDIVISTETAAANAERFSRSPGEEVARLLIHGTLHLLGWDDIDPESRKKMQRKEDHFLTLGGLKF